MCYYLFNLLMYWMNIQASCLAYCCSKYSDVYKMLYGLIYYIY